MLPLSCHLSIPFFLTTYLYLPVTCDILGTEPVLHAVFITLHHGYHDIGPLPPRRRHQRHHGLSASCHRFSGIDEPRSYYWRMGLADYPEHMSTRFYQWRQRRLLPTYLGSRPHRRRPSLLPARSVKTFTLTFVSPSPFSLLADGVSFQFIGMTEHDCFDFFSHHPTCANPIWTLWNTTNSGEFNGFFCCEADWIGDINGYCHTVSEKLPADLQGIIVSYAAARA